MRVKVTRADVAREAGVSPATVSLVLSQRGDQVGIAKATQERITATARSMGYYPNSLMRSILRGRTNILGVFVGWEQWSQPHAYWMEVTRSIQAAAALAGQDLLLHSDAPGVSTEDIFARQASGIIDGVLIHDQGPPELIQRIAESHIPCVVVGTPHPLIPYVELSSDDGVFLVVQHLIERGYTDLAYLNPVPWFTSAMDIRREGFIKAVEACGRPQDAGRIAMVQDENDPLAALRALDPKPRAVVCFNDRLAYILLGQCLKEKVDVPGELAIAGFDAIPVPPGTRQVTTVRTPIMEMCRLSVARLLEAIDGKEIPAVTTLPVTDLVIGETS